MSRPDLQARLTEEMARLSADLTRMHLDVRQLEQDIEIARATKPAHVIAESVRRLAIVKQQLEDVSKRQAVLEMRVLTATGGQLRRN